MRNNFSVNEPDSGADQQWLLLGFGQAVASGLGFLVCRYGALELWSCGGLQSVVWTLLGWGVEK